MISETISNIVIFQVSNFQYPDNSRRKRQRPELNIGESPVTRLLGGRGDMLVLFVTLCGI